MYVFEECQAFKIHSKSCHSTLLHPRASRTHVLNLRFLRGLQTLGRNRSVTWEPKYLPSFVLYFCWGRGWEWNYFFFPSVSLSLSRVFLFFFFFFLTPLRTHMTLIKKSCCCYQTLVNLSRQLWEKATSGQKFQVKCPLGFGPLKNLHYLLVVSLLVCAESVRTFNFSPFFC